MPPVTFVSDLGFALTWIHPEPAFMRRASHALVEDGRVWVVDPADGDGVLERVRALGEPAGVVQLLDRHGRDCRLFADELGVALYRVPFEGIPGSPFELLPVLKLPGWKEVALWWPARQVLAVADAIGSAPYFLAPGERLGASPVLRLTGPPGKLDRLSPRHVLCGHGEPVSEDAATALRAAVTGSRRSLPRWLLQRGRELLPFGR
jgi:hypothetical protein